jgi:2,5-diamino-6-(ribosylamino)-4(3H)-pyrimidinone 5'-phosphate reductase
VDRPSVTIHNTSSVDGRLTGFPVDLSLHYEIAGEFRHGAVLTGSGTLTASAEDEGIDLSGEDSDEPVPGVEPDDPRPWLVIVDSRARLTRLSWLRGQPFWRDVLILCSDATPTVHLDRLRRHRVEHLVAGADRVDLAAALHALADRYGVREVRVDAGGTLNGQLLRAGLVDEISVIVAPYVLGTAQVDPVHLVDGLTDGDARRLTLVAVQRLRDDHVWLRYAVARA